MSEPETSRETAAPNDMRRPWCQAASPPVQYRSPVKPCGNTNLLVSETRYGTLYNFCPVHQSQPEWAKTPPPRPPLWRRLVAYFGSYGHAPEGPSNPQ